MGLPQIVETIEEKTVNYEDRSIKNTNMENIEKKDFKI